MYVTHRLMVIHPCAKYGKSMSIIKIFGPDTKACQHPITLRSNIKVVSGSWMYATHRLMVIQPCGKYAKPLSIQKKNQLWAGHEIMSKSLRSREVKLYRFFVCFIGVYRPTREFFTHKLYGKLTLFWIEYIVSLHHKSPKISARESLYRV